MKHIKFFFGLFSLSFLLLSVSNCGSSQGDKSTAFEKNPPFTISEIYSQDWVAGVKEGGSGTNVHITFESMNEDVEVKDIYYKKNSSAARETGTSKKEFAAVFRSTIKDRIMDIDPVKEAQNIPPRASSFELLENEVVIGYTINGQKQYFKISDVMKKPAIAYPAKNPSGTE